MLDWLYSPEKAAGNNVPIDPALTEAGTSTLAPFDPFLGRTRRKASAGVTDAIKAELYDSDEFEYADYGCEASVQTQSGPSDEQPAADEASVGQDPLLAQNNASTSASRALRSPNERNKTVKSVEGVKQSPRKRGKTSQTSTSSSSERWTAAEHEALSRATDLVSVPGQALVWLGFEEVRRPQLLAEYIRRQTGTIKTSNQITRRLSRVARLPAMKDRVRSVEMSLKDARETDWHARLGLDCFPHTKPVSLLDAYGTTTTKKTAAPASPVADADSGRAKKPRLSPPDGTSTPAPDFATSSNANASGRGLAPDREVALEAGDLVEADVAVTPPSPDDSFEGLAPLDEQQPKPRMRSKKPKSRPFVIDLSAILSSLVPGRDLTTSAHALFACGITSTSYLADLLILDKDVANVFFDIVGRRMELSAFEVAWTKKALETGRNRIALEG
ncbi:Transketolase [Rhodotorula toruloides]